ncbi:MAG TPA: lysophospholipid acyltransferase family protein [Candidatus Eisenbacteria bacterium]
MSARGFPWWLEPAAAAGAVLLRVLGATWRVDRSGLGRLDAAIAGGQRCIFAFWHARMLPLVWTHRGRGIVVLVSRHRDGELITRVIERLGFGTARGSSTRGGEEGLMDMLRLASQGRLLAITPDGPRGPAETLKPGLVFLASRSGLPIVPVASASRRARVLRSWDRFRIPRPFTRVVVAYGDPIAVPAGLEGAALEEWRARVERALADHTARVAAAAGETA